MGKTKRNPKPQQIKSTHDPEVLHADAARYAKEAVKLGATDATPIKASQIIIDERVRAKCMIPKCFGYGGSAHCPPYALSVEDVKSLVAGFNWGVLLKIEVDPHLMSGYSMLEVDANLRAGREDPNASSLKQLTQAYRLMFSLVGDIESMAFYDGYHLATGFGAGSCQWIFCYDKGCQVIEKGTCRFPLRSYPSMESCAMDVYRTVTNVGWTIYPLGMRCDVSEVKHGTIVGLVLLD